MNNNITYKDSPLGKIPSDWKIDTLEKLLDEKIHNGLTVASNNIGTGTNYLIQLNDLYNAENFIDDKKLSLVNIDAKSSKSYVVQNEDLLVNRVSIKREGVGKFMLFLKRTDTETVFESNMFQIRVGQRVLPLFLLYQSQANWVFKQIMEKAKVSNQASLSQSDLLTTRFILPPLPEQARIAEVLSAWDKAISNVQATIEQVELRNKWLMQELLSGKRRLKGFSGEWKRIHIHEVAKEVSLRNKDNKQLTVLSCTKYDGLVDSLGYWGRQIFSEDISTYKIVPKNHFAYATNHIEEGSIGYQSTLDEALISPMYTVFKTDKSVNDEYFFKLLKSHRLIYEYNARMEGSIDRRGGLRWDAFSILKINLPALEEQTAINQVLQAAASEVQVLRSKLDKLKEQKKGLMQVLLTGKKRLKI